MYKATIAKDITKAISNLEVDLGYLKLGKAIQAPYTNGHYAAIDEAVQRTEAELTSLKVALAAL